MKILRTLLGLAMLAVITFFLMILTESALAQDAGTLDAPPVPPALVDTVTAVLVGLVVKHPWILTALVIMGILRAVMKPLIMVIEAVVKSTPGTSDDEALAKVEASKWWKWFLWGIDWLGSIKSPSATTTNPLVK